MSVIGALVLVALGWAGVRIVGKTGLNRWLGLLLAVPVLNLALLIWLAIADWPVHSNRGGCDPCQRLPPPDDGD